MIDTEYSGPVAVARIDHGRANTLDTEFLSAFTDRLAELRESPARAVVLTGKAAVFSAGVDLVALLDGGAAYLEGFLPALTDALEALFFYPRPVVAAINGHAVGGGCLLACACDHRLMAEGNGRIGVPEMLVGLPGPLVGLETMRAAAGTAVDGLVYRGTTHGPADALRLGLVHEVVPADDLLAVAIDRATELGRIAPEAFRITKEDLRRPALDRIERHGRRHAEEIARLWSSPEALHAVADYVERTLRRPAPAGGRG